MVVACLLHLVDGLSSTVNCPRRATHTPPTFRLAVQLSDRVMIYELYYDDSYDLKHKLKVAQGTGLGFLVILVCAIWGIVLCTGGK